MTTAPPPHQNAGLTSLVETIVAPTSAFDRLAEIPTWGWAFITASLLMMLAIFIQAPIQAHIAHIMFAQQAAAHPSQATELATAAAVSANFSRFGFIFAPIVVLGFALIGSVLLLIGSAILGGNANFKQLWSASMNVVVVIIIGAVIGSIVLALRGPDAFTGAIDLYRNSLSLAALLPTENIKILMLLTAITPFSIWALWLNSLIMQRIAHLAPPKAWAVAALVLIIPALATAGLAKQPPTGAASSSPAAAASATP